MPTWKKFVTNDPRSPDNYNTLAYQQKLHLISLYFPCIIAVHHIAHHVLPHHVLLQEVIRGAVWWPLSLVRVVLQGTPLTITTLTKIHTVKTARGVFYVLLCFNSLASYYIKDLTLINNLPILPNITLLWLQFISLSIVNWNMLYSFIHNLKMTDVLNIKNTDLYITRFYVFTSIVGSGYWRVNKLANNK